MKELKFRVWFENVERGREIDGELVWNTESYYDYDPVIDNNGLLYVEAGWDIQGHSEEKYIIEQYTGLKDKNGKEVYEGDVVRDGKGEKCRVEWNESEAHFGLYVGEQMELTDFIWMRGEDLEVIGNIHESNMEELCQKE